MVAQSEAIPGNAELIDYWPIGGAAELWKARERQVLIEGPAGTGKTIACLQKIHRAASKYAGMRALVVRKTHVSLKASALVTYQRKVLHPLDRVRFYGGSQSEPAKFLYPNGSEIIVGGMDESAKVMSTEYDMAYYNEATDGTEDDIESIDTRLRNYVMPYQQLIMDANPQYPTHWLNQRANTERTRRILSRHEDNPAYFDQKTGEMTKEGREYIASLDNLTGVRYMRLRKGLWVAAEGQVYEDWDDAIHLIKRVELPESWDRVWGLDFGFTNPFVWHCWAIDPDGRMILEHELYHTRWTVEDVAERVTAFWGKRPAPVAVVRDHDAEDAETFERKTGHKTMLADKRVIMGIQSVQRRLKKADDGKPRLMLMRDVLIHLPDQSLKDAGKPTCTAQEVPTYIWDTKTTASKSEPERPVKVNDHGQDAKRYVSMYFENPLPAISGPAIVRQSSVWG